MELSVVKALMGVRTNVHDTQIEAILPLLESIVTEQLEYTEPNPAFPADVQLLIVSALELYTNPAGVSSKSRGDTSVSYNGDKTAVVDWLKKKLDEYKKGGSNKFGFVPIKRKPSIFTGDEFYRTNEFGQVID